MVGCRGSERARVEEERRDYPSVRLRNTLRYVQMRYRLTDKNSSVGTF